MKRNGQNLLEYVLIFAMVAIIGYAFVANFDMQTIRNYIFKRPASESTVNGVTSTRINIEAMTE